MIKKKTRQTFYVSFSSSLFAGVSLCFYWVIPLTMQFLIGLGTDVGTPMITITDYFSLLSLMVIGFGVVFELPVVLLLLNFLGVIDAKTLAKYRRHVIVGSLVVAAILTPPDPISQLGLAVPLYIMYELSLLLMRGKKKGKKAEN